MNHEGVCRTGPATPGLLNIYIHWMFSQVDDVFLNLAMADHVYLSPVQADDVFLNLPPDGDCSGEIPGCLPASPLSQCKYL